VTIAASRLSGALALLLAAGAIALPWYFVTNKLKDVEPVRSPASATAFVWSGRVFAARPPFRRWLHRRGVAYAVWAHRHPAAARHLPRR